MTVGHFLVDFYGNFAASLLPVVSVRLGLPMTLCGLAMAITSVAANISQPLLGYLVDRWVLAWILVPCVAVAAVLSAPLAWLGSYGWFVALAAVAGLAVAMYHPLGSVAATAFAHGRRGLALSVYTAGGSLGYALAPLLLVPVALAFQPAVGMALLVLPGVAGAALMHLAGLTRRVRGVMRGGATGAGVASAVDAVDAVDAVNAVNAVNAVEAVDAAGAHSAAAAAGAARGLPVRPLLALNVVAALRAWAHYGLVVFIPLYLVKQGWTAVAADQVMAAFLLASTAGGVAGGALADRWGMRAMVAASTLLGGFVCGAAVLQHDLTTMVAVVVAGGFLFQAGLAPTVVIAQEAAPRRAAMASGMMMGLSWGLGGIGSILTGAWADAWGVPTALLLTLAPLPLAAALCAFVPGRRTARRRA
jgi:FSR family fosmidomycin resistance protein-like MFS transporter